MHFICTNCKERVFISSKINGKHKKMVANGPFGLTFSAMQKPHRQFHSQPQVIYKSALQAKKSILA